MCRPGSELLAPTPNSEAPSIPYPSSTMAVLINLPNELLVHIFSDLDCFDLAPVSRASRRLHAVVEPLLYQHVSLGTRRPSPPVIRLFLRTLLSRPVLAGYVRLLTLRWDTPWAPPDARKTSAPLNAVAARVGLRYPLHSHGAEIALLLHLLPGLETLDLSPPEFFDVLDDFLTSQASLPPAALAPGLQSLRTVCYRSPGRIAADMTTLLALLTLPALRTLDIGFVDVDGAGHVDDSRVAPGSSRVTDLRVGFDDVDAALLARVLMVPSALTRLELDQGGCDGARGFAGALRSVGGTLEYLALTLDSDGVCVGSLRGWEALREVRCSMAALVGPRRDGVVLGELLPQALERLWVEGDDAWRFEEVVGLVEGLVKGREAYGLVQLGRVVLEREVVEGRGECGVGRLRKMCGKVGVELVVKDAWW